MLTVKTPLLRIISVVRLVEMQDRANRVGLAATCMAVLVMQPFIRSPTRVATINTP